jgi:hypothetical protein
MFNGSLIADKSQDLKIGQDILSVSDGLHFILCRAPKGLVLVTQHSGKRLIQDTNAEYDQYDRKNIGNGPALQPGGHEPGPGLASGK